MGLATLRASAWLGEPPAVGKDITAMQTFRGIYNQPFPQGP